MNLFRRKPRTITLGRGEFLTGFCDAGDHLGMVFIPAKPAMEPGTPAPDMDGYLPTSKDTVIWFDTPEACDRLIALVQGCKDVLGRPA